MKKHLFYAALLASVSLSAHPLNPHFNTTTSSTVDNGFKTLKVTENNLPTTEWKDYAETSWYTSSQTTFVLNSPEQLAGLALLVFEGNSFEGKTIKLGADLDLGTHLWMPIGYNNDKPFSGIFDGVQYTIRNLNVNANRSFIGLFGQVVNGNIKNVTIDTATVLGKDTVGALSGNFVTSIVDNCHVSNVTVEAVYDPKSTSSGYNAGAFCGGAITETKITNCSAKGNVKGYAQIGGFIGSPWDKTSISQSSFEGNVEGENFVGGFVGFSTFAFGANRETEVSDCFAKANVTGGDKLGGFYGFAQMGTIKNSYSASTISGNGSTGAFIGAATGAAKFSNVHYSSTKSSLSPIGESLGVSPDSEGNIYSHTDDEMKTENLATLLNNGRTPSIWKYDASQNDGYPSFVPKTLSVANLKTTVTKIAPTLVENTIYITSDTTFQQYKIYDYSGRIIKTGTLNTTQIELSSLTKGNYLLELYSESRKEIHKFIKK